MQYLFKCCRSEQVKSLFVCALIVLFIGWVVGVEGDDYEGWNTDDLKEMKDQLKKSKRKKAVDQKMMDGEKGWYKDW